MASDNDFSTFPAALCHMTALEEIDLSANQIQSVTSDIKQLDNLQILDMSNNQLMEFPYAVSN